MEKELRETVLEVIRVSDRAMVVVFVFEADVLRPIYAYAT